MVQPSANRLLVEAQIGAANGLASLDAGSKIPDTQIPARLQDTALSATYAQLLVAKFDGTDETATLQVALTAAAGGKLIIPRGKTIKTKQITVPSNTELAGEGAGSVIDLIDDGSAASQTVYLNSVSGITIHDLTIKSSNATGRTGVYGLVRIGQSSGVIIRNVRFGRSPSTAVYGEQSDGVIIDGCTVTDTQADGIHISRGCTRWRVTNNNLSALAGDDAVGVVSYTSTASPWAICEDIIIQGNQVKSTTVGRGIAIVGGKNIIVRGNTITDVYQAGIIVSAINGDTSASTHYTTGVIVEGNTIRRAGTQVGGGTRSGIYVSHSRGVSVRGNMIDESGTDGITIAGAAKEVTVSDNYIMRSGSRGLFVTETTSTDARLIAALFTNMGESGVTTAGISELSITGNTIRQTVDEGLRIAGVSATQVTGLIVADNLIDPAAAVTCISLSYVNRGAISNNRCRGGANGIAPNTCQNLAISGNTVYGLSDTGVNLAGCTSCSVTNNNLSGNSGFGIYEPAGNASTLIAGNLARGNTAGQITSAGTGSSSVNNLTT